MTYTATITTKRQLTIPSDLFIKAKLKTGQKVLLELHDDQVVMKPLMQTIEALAGSVQIPKHLKGVDLDKIISKSKKDHFTQKYSKWWFSLILTIFYVICLMIFQPNIVPWLTSSSKRRAVKLLSSPLL